MYVRVRIKFSRRYVGRVHWVDTKFWASCGQERQIYKREIGNIIFYTYVVYEQLSLMNKYVWKEKLIKSLEISVRSALALHVTYEPQHNGYHSRCKIKRDYMKLSKREIKIFFHSIVPHTASNSINTSVFSIETQYIIPPLEGCWQHRKTLLY